MTTSKRIEWRVEVQRGPKLGWELWYLRDDEDEAHKRLDSLRERFPDNTFRMVCVTITTKSEVYQ